MGLLTIFLALIIFTGVSSVLAFIPGMIENLEVFRNVLLNEIFSILIIPIYLVSATFFFEKNIENLDRKSVV